MLISLLLPIVYGSIFWFSFANYQSWLWFIASLYLGYNFHIFDYLLNPFYAEANSQFEVDALYLFKQKKYFSYLKYVLMNRKLAVKLMSKSILFVGTSLPLTLFMITSSGSIIGKGLTMGLCLANLKLLVSLQPNSVSFVNFFGQSNQKITQQQLINVKIVFMVGFILLTILALVQRI